MEENKLIVICKFSVYIVANRVEMKFLHYVGGCWEFPKMEDTKIVEAKYVFMGPFPPSDRTNNGYKFEEGDVALAKYKTIKIKNRVLSHMGHQ